MEEKLITVTGKGGIHVVPDVTRLSLTLKSIHETYEEAYVQAQVNTDSLSKIMEETGLDKTLPKTTRLDIEKKTKSEYDKYRNYTGEKFIGFELNHQVKIDLGMDNELLSKIVRLIGRYLKQAEMEIGYTVRDSRPAQLKMLERAVKDAREKAAIMAKACDCKLGPVKEINYSFNEIHIYSQARMIHEAPEAELCSENSLDIHPDDLAAEDNVTVRWYLINNVEEE